MNLKNINWRLHTGILSLILLWFIIFYSKIYNPLLIPNPLNVFLELLSFFYEKELILHTLKTLSRILIAFFLSAIIGIILGLILGHYSKLDKSTESLIEFFRSIPGIVLFPLFILFFGRGDISRLLVAMFVAIPIIIINTKYGVINSRKLRKDMPKIYNLNKKETFKKIIIPETAPYIFNSLRLALSLTIILIIVSEMMIGSKYGLGQLIIKSQYSFETVTMYAIILLLGILGFMLNFFFNKIEKKIFHWR